jgi:hypothetical protein
MCSMYDLHSLVPSRAVSIFSYVSYINGGTRQRRQLRHYATSRKVAGSILEEVIGFFN